MRPSSPPLLWPIWKSDHFPGRKLANTWSMVASWKML